MEGLNRKPFQGVINIIRFNWHYYSLAFALVIAVLFIKNFLPAGITTAATAIIFLVIFSIMISLIVSWYIYDHSNLYSLNWMNFLDIGPGSQLVNINAGFDETSAILKNRYPGSGLIVLDFYDPGKHTALSIARARNAHAIFPGTKTVSTVNFGLKENSVDCIFLILAAHEIRNSKERVVFLKQLKNALRIDGRIILVEHLRDSNNFIAYNFGFFHFISKKIWKETFAKADLYEDREIKITPFISTFILKKNGIPS